MSCPNEAALLAIHTKELMVLGAQGELAARLYVPDSKAIYSSLVVFFHPGGFVCGGLEDVDGFTRALAHSCQVAVLSSTYTLACQHPFPAAAEDAHAVLMWARKHAKKLRWDARFLLTAGIEAGGNLAASASLMARDRSQPILAAQILIMPMLDPGLSSDSMRAMCNKPQVAGVAAGCDKGYRDYLPRAADRTHPYASPLHSSRLKGLAPALLLSAEDDPLRDDAANYAQKLLDAGNVAHHVRLPAVPLQDAAARSDCARKEGALQEIKRFLTDLQVI
ncbi:MAG: alpha/beta hydrolase [Burkholderiales bacterium]|nr:alpha/beta hydrolase [Burkholderiales bacterium]